MANDLRTFVYRCGHVYCVGMVVSLYFFYWEAFKGIAAIIQPPTQLFLSQETISEKKICASYVWPTTAEKCCILFFDCLIRLDFGTREAHSVNRMRTNSWNRFWKVSLKRPFTQQLRSLPRQHRVVVSILFVQKPECENGGLLFCSWIVLIVVGILPSCNYANTF